MTDRLSQIVSYIFHPLLMPSMIFGLIYWFIPEIISPLNITALPVLLVVTFVFPVINLLVLKKTGWITSFKLEQRDERPLPFVFVALFFGMSSYIFIGINETVAIIFIACTVLILVLTLITLWYKISIHAAGLSGVIGFLMSLSLQHPDSNIFYAMIAMVIIAGVVMSARLQLNAHQPREVFWGALVGLVVCFVALYTFG